MPHSHFSTEFGLEGLAKIYLKSAPSSTVLRLKRMIVLLNLGVLLHPAERRDLREKGWIYPASSISWHS